MAAAVWTCLIRIKSTDEDRSHLVEKTTFTIGRTEDADLPLTEPSVSRSHLSVELRGPSVFVTDLKSGNGTLINGQRIEGGAAIELKAGDIVKLGLAPHEFSITSIPKPFELLDVDSKQKAMTSSMQDLAVQAQRKAKEAFEAERAAMKAEAERETAKLAAERLSIKAEADRMVQEARKEAETMKTSALIELQTRKTTLESEIASLKQQVAVTASQERLKYAKDADQFMAEAQKKIAQDYADAASDIERKLQTAQEKAFALVQAAESEARTTLQEAQDDASGVRSKAMDEARLLHQEAMKKHSMTLSQLQDKFQSDMASKREELLSNAKKDGERERAKILADGARDVKAFEDQLARLKVEVSPLQTQKDKLVSDLKSLDELTTQARKELERNSKEVDSVRAMLVRTDEIKREKTSAEAELETIAKRLASSRSTVEKEIADMRQKAILEFESEKKGSTDQLAKQRLKALEDVQKRIQAEEKRYAETLSFRAIELSQRIGAKVLPALPELMADASMAGARVKAAIEAATRETLLNETSSFQAHTVNELSPQVSTKEQKSKRQRMIAFAVGTAVIVLCTVFGQDIYRMAKGSEANTYAASKMEERRIASVYHPEGDARFGTAYRQSYTENVLFMKGYYTAKTDAFNQQKWLLRLNDLELLRPMGLSEDDIVAYTSKENAMLKRLGELRDKTEGMVDAEAEDLAAIKKILKNEANFKKIHALEEEFVGQILR
jgi:vacuolar-type H+-ATPase subunit H